MPPAVDKECRRSIDATAHASEKVGAHVRRVSSIDQRIAQLGFRQAERPGKCEKQRPMRSWF